MVVVVVVVVAIGTVVGFAFGIFPVVSIIVIAIGVLSFGGCGGQF
jgi:hypothetical protein